jgi:hypothetical protein
MTREPNQNSGHDATLARFEVESALKNTPSKKKPDGLWRRLTRSKIVLVLLTILEIF